MQRRQEILQWQHSSNLTVFQSYTLSILHSAFNLKFFQSDIWHSSILKFKIFESDRSTHYSDYSQCRSYPIGSKNVKGYPEVVLCVWAGLTPTAAACYIVNVLLCKFSMMGCSTLNFLKQQQSLFNCAKSGLWQANPRIMLRCHTPALSAWRCGTFVIRVFAL